ncbi:cell wall-associated hydrolase, invasion-associated protein [Mycobacteroides abscessus subsp. abscessus]|uniref:hypothetical protein n=1 Tax=Mycobacteroides abscessus TaxID=36809 RepID=UPI00092A6F9C|nr:hypothetical protein [Mycobacteroides abscessus]SIJ21699.1 cell wall-associated hydrolase, invasion-associated protein [Mycobacteroides abscessus subsp. abscessus]SLH38857.1 cell wall-associated hydrolase, invasion-associated protein [Mycobacteroides abscessus subsp. abscessus]
MTPEIENSAARRVWSWHLWVPLTGAVVLIAAIFGFVVLRGDSGRPLHSQPTRSVTEVGFTASQISNGKTILAVGIRMRIPENGVIAALAAGVHETRLQNLADPAIPDSLAMPHDGVSTDHHALGVLAQGPSYASVSSRMNPSKAAENFYMHLLTVGDWQRCSPAAIAAMVQMSASPSGYAADVPIAAEFYNRYVDDVTNDVNKELTR